jgi:hypothetical protein
MRELVNFLRKNAFQTIVSYILTVFSAENELIQLFGGAGGKINET